MALKWPTEWTAKAGRSATPAHPLCLALLFKQVVRLALPTAWRAGCSRAPCAASPSSPAMKPRWQAVGRARRARITSVYFSATTSCRATLRPRFARRPIFPKSSRRWKTYSRRRAILAGVKGRAVNLLLAKWRLLQGLQGLQGLRRLQGLVALRGERHVGERRG